MFFFLDIMVRSRKQNMILDSIPIKQIEYASFVMMQHQVSLQLTLDQGQNVIENLWKKVYFSHLLYKKRIKSNGFENAIRFSMKTCPLF